MTGSLTPRPGPARRHAAAPGPLPRLRRAGPGRHAGTTSPPASCWPAWRRPTICRSSPRTRCRRRAAAGSAAGPGRRAAGPGAGADRHPAGRSARPTAGTTTTCPRTARRGGDTLAVLDDDADELGTAAGSPRSTPSSRPRCPGRAGPRRRIDSLARVAGRPGVESVDAVCLHRVLLPPVGVERDRLRRPGLSRAAT